LNGKLAHTQLVRDRNGAASLPGVGSGSLEDRRAFTIDTLSLDGWWSPGASSRFAAGLEWRAASGRYDYQDEANFDLLFLAPGAPEEPSRARELSVRPDGDYYDAYVDWRWKATDHITTDLGLRWDRETLSPHGSEDFSPRAGLLWQLGPTTQFRASWGRFFQAQGIDELAVSDGDTHFYGAQHAEHWVASVEHQLASALDVRIEAYRKTYEDLRPRYENLLNPLVVLPELKPDRVRIAPDSARADGVEVMLAYDAGPLNGWLSYNWSVVEDRVDGHEVARNWDQTHFVSAGATWHGGRWDFTLAASWRSGWPTTHVELLTLTPFPLVATGPRNDERLGTYLRLDAHVARHFEIGARQRLTVFADVTNLLNRKNECCVEYQIESDKPIPFLDIEPLSSLPIVPSVGVIWEF
jgi:outer membrane receptor protein involved in Fe transport